jgi:hypothetical protein
MEPSDQTIFLKIFKNYNSNVINKLPLPPVSSVYNGHPLMGEGEGGGEFISVQQSHIQSSEGLVSQGW